MLILCTDASTQGITLDDKGRVAVEAEKRLEEVLFPSLILKLVIAKKELIYCSSFSFDSSLASISIARFCFLLLPS